MNEPIQPPQKREWRLPVLVGALIAVIVLGCGVLIVDRISKMRRPSGSGPYHPQKAVSGEQIQRIYAAMKRFEGARGARPAELAELVSASMLTQDDLRDKERSKSDNTVDVVYFPAVRAGDPADMVLLCTIVNKKEGESFHVIFNDGRYAALTPHELVMALNRTYEYIGGQLAPPVTQPAS